MESKLITPQDYLLLVDTEGPEKDANPDDTVYERETGNVVKFKDRRKSSFIDFVIAHLPLNNAPVLEGVPFLPELPKQEEDVRQLAIKAGYFPIPDQEHQYLAWISGYKAASQKKWSDEDMKNFAKWYSTRNFPDNMTYSNRLEEWQSLSLFTLLVDFIPEYEGHASGLALTGHPIMDKAIEESKRLKIVNGIVQGKYVYA